MMQSLWISQSLLKMEHFSQINKDKKFLSLHLYTPPHSCPPLGCFSSLVTGMVLKIYHLCSLYQHVKGWHKEFNGHLLYRVCPHATIKPLFVKAVRRSLKITCLPVKNTFFSAKPCPQKPTTHYSCTSNIPLETSTPKRFIQKLWKDMVLLPPDKPPTLEIPMERG